MLSNVGGERVYELCININIFYGDHINKHLI